MGNTASSESYDDMVKALQNMKKEVSERCGTLSSAASKCAETAGGDPVAAKASSRIGSIVSKVQQELETVDEVIDYLQKEIARIEEEAQKGVAAMGGE